MRESYVSRVQLQIDGDVVWILNHNAIAVRVSIRAQVGDARVVHQHLALPARKAVPLGRRRTQEGEWTYSIVAAQR